MRAPADAMAFTSPLTAVMVSLALSAVSAIAMTARCTSSFISSRASFTLSMVSFTFVTVSVICCIRSANSNGSLPGIVESRGAAAAVSLPGPDAEIRAADETLGFDGRNRVGPHQGVQLLGDLELHSELLARPVRRQDLLDRARLGAGHADDRAGLQAGDFLEFRENRELLGERHLAVADHEETDREQEQSGDHEDAEARHARGRRHHPPPCERMKALTRGSSLASRSCSEPRAI